MTRTKGRACQGKKRHRTQHAADRHRRRLINAGAAPTRIDTYPCAHCDGWHVGHTGRPR